MIVQSHWLTMVRIARASAALSVLSEENRRWHRKEATRAIFRRAGGPPEELDLLVELLVEARLIETKGETIRITAAGMRIAIDDANGELKGIGLNLLRAGYFHDESRALIESGLVNDDGELECPAALARGVASQLIGLLRRWDGVQLLPLLRIPAHLVQELGSIDALLPDEATLPEWVADQKTVGNRAEAYTVKWERARASHARFIAHVARDSDSLGWDVEDRSSSELRRIEVKGRRSSDVVFNMSENEWKKAQEHGAQYELQFWGDINLDINPEVEYASLTAAGYPTRIENVAAELTTGGWEMTPTNWRVSRSA